METFKISETSEKICNDYRDVVTAQHDIRMSISDNKTPYQLLAPLHCGDAPTQQDSRTKEEFTCVSK
jgi:hypothetical protein